MAGVSRTVGEGIMDGIIIKVVAGRLLCLGRDKAEKGLDRKDWRWHYLAIRVYGGMIGMGSIGFSNK